ncbi:LOW QUALITY PROTEIN: uncharacterized protein LOC112555359 [Pomacea canaliculata]|uniref:LOW QUALITY PROTEIN: uncharacterized protein LOC112555359 n=1 Tax=Pomacea canaliculata TaxID=400727 RepID=UPI000D73F074|nr:LOW QUALITY PROTEIN: uncharacterized protein LOC112555359 [Pomacea canaliculata]
MSIEEDWVYTVNGTFRISKNALRLHRDIKCEYIPLERADDFSVREGLHIKPMLDGTPLTTDFFKVDCEASTFQRYMNIHSGVARNNAVFSRQEELTANKEASESSPPSLGNISFPPLTPPSTQSSKHDSLPSSPLFNSASLLGLRLNVFIFGFDSMSRMSWMRLLPRTRWYFLETLGGLELEGYNIVWRDFSCFAPHSDWASRRRTARGQTGRTQGTASRRTSVGVERLQTSRVRHGLRRRHGQIRNVSIGHARINEQPTDHYMRPFYLEAEKMYKKNFLYCLGTTPRHRIFMNWFEELFAYTSHPKFFFGFHREMSRNNNNPVQALDEDMVLFLERLEKSGHLNSTLLILMSDHGEKNSNVRATQQGKLEERMPYFAFRFPPWVEQVHPQLIRNMEINTKRLTTPFDIHETLLEVLTYTGSGLGDISKRAISLFKEIPKHRSCSHAGVTPHWCACLKWETLNNTDFIVMSAVKSVLNEINLYTNSHRETCALLRLKSITSAARYVPTYEDYVAEHKLRQYIRSFSQHKNQDLLGISKEVYQVSFITQPGNGHFEVTCTLDTFTGEFFVASTDISRVNKNGKHANCIAKTHPYLRPYCYCNSFWWWFW